jgi:predicted ATPase
MDRFVVISGCSSGGTSTLIADLGRRGYAVVDEPGRRIVKEELARGGSALPWVDGVAFARRAMAIALADRAAAGSLDGWVFFDRGLIDAAATLQHMTGKPVLTALGQTNRYHRRVFLAPPWPEIYETDPERRHDLGVALAEYSRLIEHEDHAGIDCTGVLTGGRKADSNRRSLPVNELVSQAGMRMRARRQGGSRTRRPCSGD